MKEKIFFRLNDINNLFLCIYISFPNFRAVKSVLVMAGSLKRENPDKDEEVVLIRALRDSNLPKFLSNDAILFQVLFK